MSLEVDLSEDDAAVVAAFEKVAKTLRPLTPEARRRVIAAVAILLDIPIDVN